MKCCATNSNTEQQENSKDAMYLIVFPPELEGTFHSPHQQQQQRFCSDLQRCLGSKYIAMSQLTLARTLAKSSNIRNNIL